MERSVDEKKPPRAEPETGHRKKHAPAMGEEENLLLFLSVSDGREKRYGRDMEAKTGCEFRGYWTRTKIGQRSRFSGSTIEETIPPPPLAFWPTGEPMEECGTRGWQKRQQSYDAFLPQIQDLGLVFFI